jgi:hypothetical protein
VGFGKLLEFTPLFDYNLGVDFGITFCALFLFSYYYFSQLTRCPKNIFLGMFIILFYLLISVAAAIFEKPYNKMKDRDSLAEMVEVKAEPQNQHLML